MPSTGCFPRATPWGTPGITPTTPLGTGSGRLTPTGISHVAAYLYPEYIESLTDQAIHDEQFIQRETGWAPAPYQRPGLDVLHRRYVELQFRRIRESQR